MSHTLNPLILYKDVKPTVNKAHPDLDVYKFINNNYLTTPDENVFLCQMSTNEITLVSGYLLFLMTSFSHISNDATRIDN